MDAGAYCIRSHQSCLSPQHTTHTLYSIFYRECRSSRGPLSLKHHIIFGERFDKTELVSHNRSNLIPTITKLMMKTLMMAHLQARGGFPHSFISPIVADPVQQGKPRILPPPRDKMKEEPANIKRELVRCQKDVRFYRKELERRNDDLQRAIDDNSLYARRIQELENANVNERSLSSPNDLTHTEVHTEVSQKNIMAISTILHHSNLLPFTELLEKVNTFNMAISRSATFLAEQVIYKVSEAFDDEMESSMEEAKEIIGARFSEMLAAQAHNAESGTSKPGGLFLRIVFQTFILNFCVSEIDPCSIISISDAGKFTSRVYWFARLQLTRLQLNQTSQVEDTIQYNLRHQRGPLKLSNPLW